MAQVGNIIAAFSEDHVERLTGLSKRQLRYWDRTGFFAPSHADEDRRSVFSRIYSFKDIVGLRTLAKLRNEHEVPLQHLRQVAEALSHLADDLWTTTTLYVLNKRVLLDEDGEGRLREAVSGQYVMSIPLQLIISDTKKDIEELKRRPAEDFGRIVRSKHVNRNAWVVAGTRIPTAAIRQFHEAGYSTEQIIKEYPDLTEEDIKSALAHEEKLGAAA